ncbi:amidohydrolase family protein [Cognatilysobacter bugurensis]|uniref:Amidohydrolase n=1 Tax=Cognatilysobacter bugurensis TaxID=543356 RepID=A0A918T3N1_9GAMM|nr:amidohydrolase family protein [Lysobacter bugurensis]GHA86533.1 amidohydrolase [Lysobacter bugurensis]
MAARSTNLLALAVGAIALFMARGAVSATPAADWVFKGRIYDGTSAPARQAEVVVRGDRITCVDAPGRCRVPRNARRVDIGDRTLMPGLIDLHVHLRAPYAPLFREGGVTSVRDANNSFATLDAVRATPGAPRVFASGPMLDGPKSIIVGMAEQVGEPGRFPIREQNLMVASTPAEATKAVDLLVAAGADHIKLYEQLAPDVYSAAAARAQHHRKPVMADLGVPITRGLDKAQVDALQAAAAGTSSIEHASGVALAYRRLGGDPASKNVDGELLERIVAPLIAADVAVVPTMIGYHTMAMDAYPTASEFPLAAKLDPQVTAWWRGMHKGSDKERDRYRQMLHLHREFLRRFVARGGRLGAGTDAPALPMLVPGDALHHELRLLTGLGLTPVAALHAATGGAARILGTDEVGEIAPGRFADMVLVEGDPTRTLADSRRITAVWQGGRLVHGAVPSAKAVTTVSKPDAQLESAR